jgi:hypothetical protein
MASGYFRESYQYVRKIITRLARYWTTGKGVASDLTTRDAELAKIQNRCCSRDGNVYAQGWGGGVKGGESCVCVFSVKKGRKTKELFQE